MEKILKTLMTVSLMALIVYFAGNYILNKNHQTLVSSAISAFNIVTNSLATYKITLKEIVDESVKDLDDSYSVVVKNLKTGESYAYNAHHSYESASLYKLWIMAETFDQIEKGQLKENEILSEDIPTLNNKFNINPSSAELTEGTISLSVADALNQMITISHNYAALLLSEKIRLSNVRNYLSVHDLTETSLGEPPKTTASDMAVYLEKLYKGDLGNQESTDKMISLLKNQKLNSKLPKYLPAGTVIAHKTGELGDVSHDAGIVYGSKGDYIIVVLSKTSDQSLANEEIANISKNVYNYFEKSTQ